MSKKNPYALQRGLSAEWNALGPPKESAHPSYGLAFYGRDDQLRKQLDRDYYKFKSLSLVYRADNKVDRKTLLRN